MSEKGSRSRSRSPLRPDDENEPKRKEKNKELYQEESEYPHEEIREKDLQPLSPSSPVAYKPKNKFVTEQPSYLYLNNIPKTWKYYEVKKFIAEHTSSEFIIKSVQFIDILRDHDGNRGACKIVMSSQKARDKAFTTLRGIYVDHERVYVEINPERLKEPIKHKSDLYLQKQNSSYVPPNERNNDKFPPINETYGLSTDFLNALNIKPPLVSTVIVINVKTAQFDEMEVRSVFGLAGEILNVQFFPEKNKMSITYDHPVEAVQAISMFNGQVLRNSMIKVKMDRFQTVTTIIPKGMQSIGPGLGTNGKPLTGVRAHVEITNLKKSLSNILNKPDECDHNKNMMPINQGVSSQEPWMAHTSQVNVDQPSQSTIANPQDPNIGIQMALAALIKQNTPQLMAQTAQILTQMQHQTNDWNLNQLNPAVTNFLSSQLNANTNTSFPQPSTNTNSKFSNFSATGPNVITNMAHPGTDHSNELHPGTNLNSNYSNIPPFGPNMNSNFANIPQAGPNINTNMPQAGPNMNTNIPQAGPNMNTKIPNMNSNFANIPQAGPNMNTNIPQAGPNMNTNIPQPGLNMNTNIPQAGPNMNTNIPQAGPNMNTNISQAGPNMNTNIPQAGPNMNTNIPQAGSNMNTNIPQAGSNMNTKIPLTANANSNYGNVPQANSNMNANNYGHPPQASANMNPNNNNYGQPPQAGANMNPNNYGNLRQAVANMNPNNFGHQPSAGAHINPNYRNTPQVGMNANPNPAGMAPPEANVHTNYHNAPPSGANVNKNFTNMQQQGPNTNANNFGNLSQPALAKPTFIYDNVYNNQDRKDNRDWDKSNFDAKPSGEVLLMFNNLPSSVTQMALSSKMREVGEVKMVEMTGKGRAIVRFVNAEDAKKCRRLFHYSRVDGKRIEVDFF